LNKIYISGGFGAWSKSLPAAYIVIISECRSNIRDILVRIGGVQAGIRDFLPEILGSCWTRIWVIMLSIRDILVRFKDIVVRIRDILERNEPISVRISETL
jgi:hypothetical protein